MDQRYLEYILVLAETGNMTRAAKKLYISQPTLSQFLSKQEAELGTPLFQRNEGVYTLTPLGELYAEYAKKVLALTNILERDIKRISTTIRINIGNSASRSLQMLTSILADFRQCYPKVELTMSDCNLRSMSSAIAKDEVDIAFVTAPDISQYKGSYIELKKEEILFAVPRPHPFLSSPDTAKHCSLTNKELLEHFGTSPFILQPKETCIRILVEAFFETQDFDPMIAFSTSHAQSISDMVSSNIGVGFIPAGYAAKGPGITYFSLNPPMYRTHYILYGETPGLQGPCRHLIELARQYVEKNW